MRQIVEKVTAQQTSDTKFCRLQESLWVNSVHRPSLWCILIWSSWRMFIVITGMRQIRILSPHLYIYPCNRLGREECTDWFRRGSAWTGQIAATYVTKLCRRHCLIGNIHEKRQRRQMTTDAAKNEDKKIGLYINVRKCRTVISDDWKD